MTEPADEASIQWLLGELQSTDPNRRWVGAKEAGKRHLRDKRLIAVLKTLATMDPAESVRTAAGETLSKVPPEELAAIAPAPIYGQTSEEIAAAAASLATRGKQLTRNEKWRDFLIGFVGWYVVNGAIWILLTQGPSSSYGGWSGGLLYFNIFIMGGNLVELLIFTFIRRWIALGILASYAFNFLVAMALGLMDQAACWIPFFIK